ncbi:MAG: phosphatidate cytidylyltransferase [Flavobacteriaceae bacterium]|nr:phosphatidate cytidylyltransferase [Flavobacteriaceae bacterium]MDG1962273.1 phosphatidate cytidylyltransferase [Flavobacteriaceae bacterium]
MKLLTGLLNNQPKHYMKELLVRTISGLIYMTLVLFAMYSSSQYYLILTGVLGLLTLFEFQRLIQIKSIVPYLLFCIFFYLVHTPQAPFWATPLIGLLGVFMNLYLILSLFDYASHQRLERKYIPMVFYIMIGILCMGLIPFHNGIFDAHLIAGVFVLIWVNDSMAYLVGVNFGRRKLLERVSPKKTIEGTLGGLVGSLICGAILAQYILHQSLVLWLILAGVIACFGTIGDLIQSKFKRKAQVKDSGRLLPGHGGIYDRLDSIIFVSPFVYTILQITYYVS